VVREIACFPFLFVYSPSHHPPAIARRGLWHVPGFTRNVLPPFSTLRPLLSSSSENARRTLQNAPMRAGVFSTRHGLRVSITRSKKVCLFRRRPSGTPIPPFKIESFWRPHLDFPLKPCCPASPPRDAGLIQLTLFLFVWIFCFFHQITVSDSRVTACPPIFAPGSNNFSAN